MGDFVEEDEVETNPTRPYIYIYIYIGLLHNRYVARRPMWQLSQCRPGAYLGSMKEGPFPSFSLLLPPFPPFPTFPSGLPFPSPPSPILLTPLPPLPSHPLSLEVGSLNPARGSGERCKLRQRVLAKPAAKLYLVHFGLKIASAKSKFKCIFTKIHQTIWQVY